jgi:ADP-heptose:LPS heptosyltransferase
LNEIILFDRRYLGKAWYNPMAFAGLVSLVRLLRRSRFDTVIDFQGLFRTAVLAWLSGCRRRMGMANARELAHLFYTHKVTQDRNCVHLVDYYLKIVRAAGGRAGGVRFALPGNFDSRDRAAKLLSEHGIEDDPYAVFAPGSAHGYKCWPPDRFGELAERISSEFGLAAVAIGTADERPLVEKMQASARSPVANLAGITGLGALVALLDKADLVVSNDTGPGHIAAALDKPLVLIFGRSNPVRVEPYGRSDCVVAIEPDGRGLELKSTDPRHDIKEITVDQVHEAARRQLGR